MRPIFKMMLSLALTLNIACQKQADYQSQVEEVFPPVEINHVALYQMDGFSVSPSFFRGEWTLVTFGQAACAEDCRQRLALVNEVKSIKKLFVITDLADHTQMRSLGQLYKDVSISMGTTAVSFDNFFMQFVEATGDPELVPSRVYLVNPDGELSYSLAQENLKPGAIDQELRLLEIESK